jgi:hypothetical protein
VFPQAHASHLIMSQQILPPMIPAHHLRQGCSSSIPWPLLSSLSLSLVPSSSRQDAAAPAPASSSSSPTHGGGASKEVRHRGGMEASMMGSDRADGRPATSRRAATAPPSLQPSSSWWRRRAGGPRELWHQGIVEWQPDNGGLLSGLRRPRSGLKSFVLLKIDFLSQLT